MGSIYYYFDNCNVITLIQNQLNGLHKVVSALWNLLTIAILYSQFLKAIIWCCATLLTCVYAIFLYQLFFFPLFLPTFNSNIITSSPSPVERIFKLHDMKTECLHVLTFSRYILTFCHQLRHKNCILSRIYNIFQAKPSEIKKK